jgi:thymidylate kinase
MRIIVEGADGTGKTTLVKELAKKYNLDSLNINRYDPNNFNFYLETLKKTNVIFDRHFIGEMIYPSIFNRKGNLKRKDFEWLLDYCKENDIKIIILYKEKNVLKKRQKLNEYPEVLNNILKINEKFIEIAHNYEIPLIDTEYEKIEDICEFIESC